MWPLLIVSQVMGGMRPASAASEAIEAEVLLKVWHVLHPRVVGEGDRRAQRAVVGVGEPSELQGCVTERSEAPAGRPRK